MALLSPSTTVDVQVDQTDSRSSTTELPSTRQRRLSAKSQASRSKKDTTFSTAIIDESGKEISPAERDLRIAEADILFPKYTERYNQKRAKGRSSKRDGNSESSRLYLPDSEYQTKWEPEILKSAPSLIPAENPKLVQYFQRDCRNLGAPLAKYGPNETENDPLFYDLEWNQRLAPLQQVFLDPPAPRSLDDQPIFSSKKDVDSDGRVLMDSFIMELKKELGVDYVDRNEMRYFPRSDGRAYSFWDSKSRKYKQMKNGHIDIETFRYNRFIMRITDKVKLLLETEGIPWTEEVEDEWRERIAHFVNPFTVEKGRSFFMEQEELGIEDERYHPPERLGKEQYEAPPGMTDDDLGQKFYWSELKGRMVSVQELRQ
jgi:hypothetical protein